MGVPLSFSFSLSFPFVLCAVVALLPQAAHTVCVQCPLEFCSVIAARGELLDESVCEALQALDADARLRNTIEQRISTSCGAFPRSEVVSFLCSYGAAQAEETASSECRLQLPCRGWCERMTSSPECPVTANCESHTAELDCYEVEQGILSFQAGAAIIVAALCLVSVVGLMCRLRVLRVRRRERAMSMPPPLQHQDEVDHLVAGRE